MEEGDWQPTELETIDDIGLQRQGLSILPTAGVAERLLSSPYVQPATELETQERRAFLFV